MYTAFAILAVIALAVQGLILFLAFFGPDMPYDVKTAPDFPLASREFANLLATLTDAQLHPGNRIEVLTDGPCFYQAELEAIASARHTINLMAVCDSAIAARLRQDFERDLSESEEVTYDDWRKYRRYRIYEWIGALIAKQE